MNTEKRPDSVNTHVVFRVYAGVAALAGLLLLLGAPRGVTTALGSSPAEKALFVRMAGASLLAAACVALGFAQVEDPRNRRQALRWFANAHLVLFTVLLIGAAVQGGSADGEVALPAMATATMLLYYFYQTGDGHRPGESTAMI